MATVYIKPGSGTGTGTASDPYYYSQLSAAETAAGNGGTILFTDGTYSFTSNKTWDSGGNLNNMTYKSLNDQGAYLLGEGAIRQLTIGSSSTTAVNIEGFKQSNIHWYGSGSLTATISKIQHFDTISGTRGGLGLFVFINDSTILNSSFVLDYSGSDRLFHTASNPTITGCSFYLKCSSVGANGITHFGGSLGNMKNTIFMSDNSSAIDASVIDVTKCTNCCIFQMHSGDSSGGTNNVFADPQFVDVANGDLRLRPTSPCIGAGTV